MIIKVHGRDNGIISKKNVRFSLEGFTTERVKQDVLRLHNQNSLMYIKSPVPAYSASHNPTVCWQGSGYNFKKIEKLQLNEIDVNLAILKKGEDILHTAWWFEGLNTKTGDAWQWRVHALQNDEDFYLINLTCASRKQLINQLNQLLSQRLIPSGE